MGGSSALPVHMVEIKARFAIGRYEVTFDEYDVFAIVTGRPFPDDQGWGRNRRPVINVSWDDATAYATWLSEATGKKYRLPSESEWEFAARNRGKDDIWAGTSDHKELKDFAVFYGNSQNRTATVGSKKPNALGLYDMNGNVWEWVEDCWHDNYQGAPPDGAAWIKGQDGNCSRRVFRGGSWGIIPGDLRSSLRDGSYRDDSNGNIGFRLAQDLN